MPSVLLCLVGGLVGLREECVLVPADGDNAEKIFVCGAHYCSCILCRPGIGSTSGYRASAPAALSEGEILRGHASVLGTFGVPVDESNEYEVFVLDS